MCRRNPTPPRPPRPFGWLGLKRWTPVSARQRGIAVYLPSSSAEKNVPEWHEQLLNGSSHVPDQIARWALATLLPRLHQRYPVASSDVINDAAEDALLEYLNCPRRFNPALGVPLGHYLYWNARRNVLDALRAESARRRRETRYADKLARWCYPRDLSSVELTHLVRRAALNATAVPTERTAILHWLQGSGTIASMAQDLEISHLPLEQLRPAVKRFRDRLLKRIKNQLRRSSARSPAGSPLPQ